MVTRTIVLGPAFDHLADDTEETLVGSSYHQDAIIDVYRSLRRYRRQCGLPWFIGNQLKLLVPRADGRPAYSPSPDVLIHTTLGTDPRASLSVAREGPPALIIEVLSPSTGLGTDLDLLGKVGAYAAMGVAEYLTFDPTGEIIAEQLRAWRLAPEGTSVSWEPTAAWRWQSDLGIAFAPQGLRLRVFDEAGAPIPGVDELDEGFDEQARELAAEREQRLIRERMLTEETARRILSERELAALRAELERLRDKE